jgi:precorrin-6B C5,15-methyltransferase / cobalt-precorrin-6B C5,C15-methyltransferase
VGRGVNDNVSITVIGYDGAPLPTAAHEALHKATLIIGGARHLAAASLDLADSDDPRDVRTITLGPLAPALEALAAHDGPAVVLASGDPGFFGVLRALNDAGLEPARIVPAVSSVATAFARAGIPWDDALIISTHGVGDGRDLRRAANVCRAHPKVALLTGPNAGAAQLARELLGSGSATENGAVPIVGRLLVVAQRLNYAGVGNRPIGLTGSTATKPNGEGTAERVEFLTPAQAAGRTDFAEPNVVLCFDPYAESAPKRWLAGWTGPAAPWALPETAFEHRAGQITKAEVRAQVLARLAPALGELVWDLGAGSGSVAIECARFGAAVVAVEQDADSRDRIRANAEAHGVNVAVVPGRAPGVLADLPRPDAVFVGGGGLDVVRAALEAKPDRIVVTLASVERVGKVIRLLEADGRTVGGVLSQSSRLAPLPDGTHRFAALNPVYVLWGNAS